MVAVELKVCLRAWSSCAAGTFRPFLRANDQRSTRSPCNLIVSVTSKKIAKKADTIPVGCRSKHGTQRAYQRSRQMYETHKFCNGNTVATPDGIMLQEHIAIDQATHFTRSKKDELGSSQG